MQATELTNRAGANLSSSQDPGDGTPLRVLYSFPHKLGGDRICYTAWSQVTGLARAGAQVTVFPGVLNRPVPPEIRATPTLSRGGLRIPYKLLGRLRAFALHDYIVARRIEKMAGQFDVIHTWPLGARETLKTARRLGIATVYERPNPHTGVFYGLVENECKKLGLDLAPGHEHGSDPRVLEIENEEYMLADRILCASDFVVRTFLGQGFPQEKLARHMYGYDESVYYPDQTMRERPPFTLLFVGGCSPVKGLHYALEAWLRSSARHDGRFLIAGGATPEYVEKLAPMLSDPSIQMLGHRTDVPELMRQADALVLPSIAEGFGLVCADALGSGCVPLVSNAVTDICQHMENALVHAAGDVEALTSHISMLHDDSAFLKRMREAVLSSAPNFTWTIAGQKLLTTYQEAVASKRSTRS